ncbi:MAG TPA: hypothetical protein VIY51_21135 [Xanthobacteraceae bacterium]
MTRWAEKLKWNPIGSGAIRGALESKQTASAEEDKRQRQATLFARVRRRFQSDADDVAGAGPEHAPRHEIIDQETYRETLERLVVRLLLIAEQCTDLPTQRDLRNLANDHVRLIEGCHQSDEARQSH